MKRFFVLVLLIAVLLTPGQAMANKWVPAAAQSQSDTIVTLDHSSFGNGIVKLQFDYNTNTGNVVRFRCINNSDFVLRAWVYDVDPITNVFTQLWTGDCAAHQTVTLPVSKFDLAWDLVDGGLIMGNYRISTQYPAAS